MTGVLDWTGVGGGGAHQPLFLGVWSNISRSIRQSTNLTGCGKTTGS